MLFRKVLTCAAAAFFTLALSLDLASGCRCLSRELCEHVDDSDVVVHATALSSSGQADQFEDVVYTLEIITVYKGEPEWVETNACEISFVTAGSSAACGVTLAIGEEYLFGLSWSSQGYFTASSCGLARAWNEEDMTVLEANGCDGDDDHPE